MSNDEIKKLKAENDRLWACIEEIAQMNWNVGRALALRAWEELKLRRG